MIRGLTGITFVQIEIKSVAILQKKKEEASIT